MALAGLAVVFAAGAVMLWPPQNRVTRENYDNIREGMSRAQVESILGPPGDYSTGPSNLIGPDLDSGGSADWSKAGEDFGKTNLLWASDEGVIQVQFGPRGAIHKGFALTLKQDHGGLDKLLWRARRTWWRWFPPDDPVSRVTF
jgi:hypothetical protein